MSRAFLLPLLATGCGSSWTLDDGRLGAAAGACADPVSIYIDADGDGHGDPRGFVERGCVPGPGQADNATDCDDTNPDINPDAQERCNGIDDDCDPLSSEQDAVDATLWYLDGDGDGYGEESSPVSACEAPNEAYGFVGGDCNDSDPTIHPGAPETCDDVDQDCDGDLDDGQGPDTVWFRDDDGDGFGLDDDTVTACAPPDGYASLGGDCLDEDLEGQSAAAVFPGSTTVEVPFDGIDSNCDGEDQCVDLDCNGLPDIVVPNHSREGGARSVPSVVHFDGGAGGSMSLSFQGVRAIAADDLDGDGYLDIVVASEGSDASAEVPSVIRWGGPPTDPSRFEQTTLLATSGARDVVVDDLDADGHLDIVFANHHDNEGRLDIESVVYWGRATGFDDSRATPLPTHGATDVLVDDIDGDGQPDIVFCNQATGAEDGGLWATESYIYWNRGGTMPFDASDRAAFPTVGCASVEAVDANADGVLDLYFASWHDGAGNESPSVAVVSVRGESRHTGSAATPLPGTNGWRVRPGDLNGDGVVDLVSLTWKDILTGSWETPGRAMYGSDATHPTWGTANGRALPSTGSGNGVVVDLNLDGFDDIIVPGYLDDSGDIAPGSTLWFGRATGISSTATFRLDTPNARSVAVGDLDLDGLPDLVFVGSVEHDSDAAVSVYLANEPPSSTSGYDSVPNRVLGGVHVTKAPPLIVGSPD